MTIRLIERSHGDKLINDDMGARGSVTSNRDKVR